MVNHSCRDDIKPTSKREENGVRMVPDQVSYYFQLAQQHQQSLQNGGAQANPTQVTHASTELGPTSARLDRFKLEIIVRVVFASFTTVRTLNGTYLSVD